MTIDSFNRDQNTHTDNTKACDNYILGGVEPINWAYITKSGVSQAPADPLFTGTFDNPNFAAVNPDFNRDLMMKPGDVIRIHMHDTPAGFRTDLTDLTTHQSGSMTASIANGFAHVLYTPGAGTCTSAPYAFHAEYSTANARGNTWMAHLTNVSFADEIGHFEHCLQLDADFNCAVAGSDDPGGLDVDDGQNFCVPGKDAWVVHIKRVLLQRRGLRWALVPERLARIESGSEGRPEDSPGARDLHEPDDQRTPVPDDPVRGRPRCDREHL